MDLQAMARTGVPRRLQVNHLRWGAVIGGVIVGLSLYLLLMLFGAAAGLVGAPALPAPGAGSWVGGLWSLVSVSAGVGTAGYVTGRLAGMARRSDGFLHGAVAWGSLTVPLALLVVTGTATPLAQAGRVLPPVQAWWLFLILLVSLLAALWGGAAGVRRVAERDIGGHDDERQLRA